MGKGYTSGDAAKDTGVSSKEASSAHHGARDDAFGSKSGGNRDYNSGGDRTTGKDAAAAYEVGKDHGLHGGGSKSGDGGSSGGSGGGGK